MSSLGREHPLDSTTPDENAPWADGDFFPEKKPGGYPSFHNYKRDREAARLKAMGYSLDEICEKLHLTDARTGEIDERRAIAAVRRGLSLVHQVTVDEKRLEQLQTAQLMKRHLWESLERPHVMVQQGRVIMQDGLPMEDRRFVLETMDRILKIEQWEMDLTGTKSVMRMSVEADQIGGEIASLIAVINEVSTDTAPAVEAQPSRPELTDGFG